jgi:TP901 family phage tail tape measure protein
MAAQVDIELLVNTILKAGGVESKAFDTELRKLVAATLKKIELPNQLIPVDAGLDVTQLKNKLKGAIGRLDKELAKDLKDQERGAVTALRGLFQRLDDVIRTESTRKFSDKTRQQYADFIGKSIGIGDLSDKERRNLAELNSVLKSRSALLRKAVKDFEGEFKKIEGGLGFGTPFISPQLSEAQRGLSELTKQFETRMRESERGAKALADQEARERQRASAERVRALQQERAEEERRAEALRKRAQKELNRRLGLVRQEAEARRKAQEEAARPDRRLAEIDQERSRAQAAVLQALANAPDLNKVRIADKQRLLGLQEALNQGYRTELRIASELTKTGIGQPRDLELAISNQARLKRELQGVAEALREVRRLERADSRSATFQAGKAAVRRVGGVTGSLDKLTKAELPAATEYLKTRLKDLPDLLERVSRRYGENSRQAQAVSQAMVNYSHALGDARGHLEGFRGSLHQAAVTLQMFLRYALGYGALYQVLNAVKALASGVVGLQDKLKSVQAVAQATPEQMNLIAGAVRRVATETQFTTDEIAKAAQTLAQAGVAPEDISRSLRSVALFASATESSLENAADVMSTMKDVFGGMTDARVADMLTRAVNISKLTSEGLGTIISRGAQVAHAYGLSAEQFLAAATVLRNAGIKESTIATNFRQALIDMLSPDEQMLAVIAKRYREMGEKMTFPEIRARFSGFAQSGNPLIEALREYQRLGLGGSGTFDFRRAFGNVEAENAINALITHLGDLESHLAQLSSGGAAARGAQTQMESLSKSFSNLGSAIISVASSLTDRLLPKLADTAQGLTRNIEKIDELITKAEAATGKGFGPILEAALGVGAATFVRARGGFAARAAKGAGAAAVAAAGGTAAAATETASPEQVSTVAEIVGVVAWISTAVGILAASWSKVKGSMGALGASRLALAGRALSLTSVFGWVSLLASAVALIPGVSSLFRGRDAEELQTQIDALNKQLDKARAEQGNIRDQFASVDLANPKSQARLVQAARYALVSVDLELTRSFDIQTERLGEVHDILAQLAERGLDAGGEAHKVLMARLANLLNVRGFSAEQDRKLSALAAKFKDANRDVAAARSDLIDAVSFSTLHPINEYEKVLAAQAEAITRDGALHGELSDDPAAVAEALLRTYQVLIQAGGKAMQERLSKEENRLKRELAPREVDSLLLKQGDDLAAALASLRQTAAQATGRDLERITALVQELDTRLRITADAALEGVVYDQRGKPAPAREGAIPPGQQAAAEGLRQDLTAIQSDAQRAIQERNRQLIDQYNAQTQEMLRAAKEDPTGGLGKLLNVDPLDDLFQKYGEMYGVPPRLLKATANAETDGDFAKRAQAVSRKGAIGLMQLMPDTAARFGVKDPRDVAQAIEGAAKYYQFLLNKFDGNVALAAAGYNAGEGSVDKYGGIPPFEETQAYVPKVMKMFEAYGPAFVTDTGGPVTPDYQGPLKLSPQAESRRKLYEDYVRRQADEQEAASQELIRPYVEPFRLTAAAEKANTAVSEALNRKAYDDLLRPGGLLDQKAQAATALADDRIRYAQGRRDKAQGLPLDEKKLATLEENILRAENEAQKTIEELKRERSRVEIERKRLGLRREVGALTQQAEAAQKALDFAQQGVNNEEEINARKADLLSLNDRLAQKQFELDSLAENEVETARQTLEARQAQNKQLKRQLEGMDRLAHIQRELDVALAQIRQPLDAKQEALGLGPTPERQQEVLRLSQAAVADSLGKLQETLPELTENSAEFITAKQRILELQGSMAGFNGELEKLNMTFTDGVMEGFNPDRVRLAVRNTLGTFFDMANNIAGEFAQALNRTAETLGGLMFRTKQAQDEYDSYSSQDYYYRNEARAKVLARNKPHERWSETDRRVDLYPDKGPISGKPTKVMLEREVDYEMRSRRSRSRRGSEAPDTGDAFMQIGKDLLTGITTSIYKGLFSGLTDGLLGGSKDKKDDATGGLFTGFATTLKTGFSTVRDELSTWLTQDGGFFTGLFNTLKGGFGSLWSSLSGMFSSAESSGGGGSGGGWLGTAVSTILAFIKDGAVLAKFAGGGFPGSSPGGIISGPGSETSDSIPALLTAGGKLKGMIAVSNREAILNARATKMLGADFINRVNRGTLSGAYAAGGVLSGHGRDAVQVPSQDPNNGYNRGTPVVQIIDQRRQGAPDLEVTQSKDSQGRDTMRITIREELKKVLSSGYMDKTMSSNFGAKRPGFRR